MKIKRNKYGIARSRVKTVLEKCESFKIGKTGMDPYTDRLNETDYAEEHKFTNIEIIYQSEIAEEVSEMEARMIDEFLKHPKCKNKKDGDGSVNDNMADADIYTTYIVWK